MILRHGWSVKDLTDLTGKKCFSLGEVGGGNRAALKASQPHWATKLAIHLDKFNETNIVMTFNHDWHDQILVHPNDLARVIVRDLVDQDSESNSCDDPRFLNPTSESIAQTSGLSGDLGRSWMVLLSWMLLLVR
jgi:hypothetical protein